MSMTNAPATIDNVLLLAIILSVILHLALLYSDADVFFSYSQSGYDTDIEDENAVQIPIEFIPGAIQFVSRSSLSVSRETVQKIVHQAQTDEDSLPQKSLHSGHYSFIHQQAHLRRYLQAVREEIEKHKYLAAGSRHRALIGNVKVTFEILADGTFSRVKVIDSSGDARVDRASVFAVKTASGKIKRNKNTGTKKITTTAVIKYQHGL